MHVDLLEWVNNNKGPRWIKGKGDSFTLELPHIHCTVTVSNCVFKICAVYSYLSFMCPNLCLRYTKYYTYGVHPCIKTTSEVPSIGIGRVCYSAL